MNSLRDQCQQAEDDVNIAVAAFRQLVDAPVETALNVILLIATLTVVVFAVAICGAIGG